MADAVVIGGGPNGLAAATRLARRGRSVVLLERREVLGGLAASQELAPGYRTAGVLPETAVVSAEVADLLDLDQSGLARASAPRPPVLLLQEDGPSLLLDGDPALAAEEIGRHSTRDAERYAAWRAFLTKAARVIGPLRQDAPPDVLGPGTTGWLQAGTAALGLRRLGRRDMLEVLRIAPTCAADWLNEWFETELLKAGLALPGIAGTWLGPWSAGSTLNLLFHECGSAGEVQGGAPALVRALEAAARRAGVELRTGAAVTRVLVEGGRVKGVVHGDGEVLEAPTVVATCDPKRALLELVPPQALTQRLEHDAQCFRARGTTAVVHLALSAPLELAARPGTRVARARIGATLDDLERAFDGVKYGRMPERPTLEVFVPSRLDPSLAPAGHAVVTVHAHHVPYELEGGWTDARRDELGRLVLDTLAPHAPGLPDAIVAREVLSPADLERRYALTGGHLHHGEHALDQLLVRPTPDTARYATPIRGLYLGGGGSHPGGGLTLIPGWNAAARVLRG